MTSLLFGGLLALAAAKPAVDAAVGEFKAALLRADPTSEVALGGCIVEIRERVGGSTTQIFLDRVDPDSLRYAEDKAVVPITQPGKKSDPSKIKTFEMATYSVKFATRVAAQPAVTFSGYGSGEKALRQSGVTIQGMDRTPDQIKLVADELQQKFSAAARACAAGEGAK